MILLAEGDGTRAQDERGGSLRPPIFTLENWDPEDHPPPRPTLLPVAGQEQGGLTPAERRCLRGSLSCRPRARGAVARGRGGAGGHPGTGREAGRWAVRSLLPLAPTLPPFLAFPSGAAEVQRLATRGVSGCGPSQWPEVAPASTTCTAYLFQAHCFQVRGAVGQLLSHLMVTRDRPVFPGQEATILDIFL